MKPLFFLSVLCPLAWAQFSINYVDDSNFGFFDPQEVSPVGGNMGTTLGEQRRLALEHAVRLWERHLEPEGPVVIQARFSDDLSIFTLATANFGAFFINFEGAPDPNLAYPASLANHIAQRDLSGEEDEIIITFNANHASFYLGLDLKPEGEDDFQTTAIHEIAHGLGFRAGVSADGSFEFGDRPTVFDAQLHSLIFGKNYSELTVLERQTASRAPGLTIWQGRSTQLGSRSQISAGQTAIKIGLEEDGETTQTFFALPANIGPALPVEGIRGRVILVDDGTVPTADACQTPFVNASELAGNIALIDRGACTFVSKIAAATEAGAIAVIIANNVPSGPAAVGGAGLSPTIPSVGVDQATGLILRNLDSSTLVTLGVEKEAGTLDGRPYLWTPANFNEGSSLSHWDEGASPNLLMEPTSGSLPGQFDLTLTVLRDLGWTVKNIPFPNTDYAQWEALNVNTVVGREEDADRDGFTNFAEYAGGSDPENPNSQPTHPRLLRDGTLFLTRTNQATDLTFELQRSTTLNEDFIDFPSPIEVQEIIGEQRLDTIFLGPLSGREFFRDLATEETP